MILQIAAAFSAILMFSVMVDAPKRYLVYCGLVGAFGWFVYLVTQSAFGIMTANFLAAVAISLIAHLFARCLKAPVTVFLLPGFLMLVPGSSLYRAVYNFFMGSGAEGGLYLIQALQIAGVIALGIFVVDSLFDILRKRFIRRRGDEHVQEM